MSDLINGSCPCCGKNTIDERGIFEICHVCWWEDDGQDNRNAEIIAGGPNGNLSLAQGRYNFLVHGIYDPLRTDLLQQNKPSAFRQIRSFEISGNYLIEKNTLWNWQIDSKKNQ